MTRPNRSLPVRRNLSSVLTYGSTPLLAIALLGCFSASGGNPDSGPGTDSGDADTSATQGGATAPTSSASGSDNVDDSSGMTTSDGPDDGPDGGPDDGPDDGPGESSDTTTGDGQDDSATDESTSDGAVAECGNGVLDDDEVCDDGNLNELDACTLTCEEQYASGNDFPCPADLAEHCAYFAAQCRLTENGEESICYWADSTAAPACDDTPGIWTPSDSGYAMAHPEMFFPGNGACITEAPNLECSGANATTCDNAGAALCLQSLQPDGLGTTGPDICWWDVNEGACAGAGGVWTTPASGFAQGHPNALPAGAAACITQVTNL